MSKLPEPLPCPFCGAQPEVGPTGNRKGDAYGWVAMAARSRSTSARASSRSRANRSACSQCCVNIDCPAEEVMVRDGEPIVDDRGREAYQALAVLRWNRRWHGGCPHVTGDTTMHCEQAERFARERDEARAEVERLRASLSKCLLSDPPGDCYAAECVELRAERDAIQKAFDARADEFAEMRRESWRMGVRLREARDEVERLRDSLSVTGDTRHEAMEAAIRVAQAHSETIRQLRAEVERLRAVIAEAGHLAHRCVQLTRERDDARRLVEMMRDDPGAIVPVPLPWEGE